MWEKLKKEWDYYDRISLSFEEAKELIALRLKNRFTEEQMTEAVTVLYSRNDNKRILKKKVLIIGENEKGIQEDIAAFHLNEKDNDFSLMVFETENIRCYLTGTFISFRIKFSLHRIRKSRPETN